MCNRSSLSSLIGNKYILTVSEPWNFNFPSGTNSEEVEIVDSGTDQDGVEFIVFKLTYKLNIKSINSATFIASSRYSGVTISKDFVKNKDISFNIRILRDNSSFSKQNSDFVFIGSLGLKNY